MNPKESPLLTEKKQRLVFDLEQLYKKNNIPLNNDQIASISDSILGISTCKDLFNVACQTDPCSETLQFAKDIRDSLSLCSYDQVKEDI